jgi:hypothetical protein
VAMAKRLDFLCLLITASYAASALALVRLSSPVVMMALYTRRASASISSAISSNASSFSLRVFRVVGGLGFIF